jgi:threonine aldolase
MRDDLWIRNAARANAMAAELAARIGQVDGVSVISPPQTNVVRAKLSPEVVEVLRRTWAFTISDELAGEVRWVCSWNTKLEDIERFVVAVGAIEADTPRIDARPDPARSGSVDPQPVGP